MTKFLVVPIRIDALCLQKPLAVVGPTADFSKLPYSNGTFDYHPGTPFISEAIASHPFQDQDYTLQPGIHLHWALPDFLNRSMILQTIDKQTFLDAFTNNEPLWQHLIEIGWLKPIGDHQASIMDRHPHPLAAEYAPLSDWINQFLHRPPRTDFPTVPNRWLVTRSGGALDSRQWLVESDYLAPQGIINHTGGVAIPYPLDAAKGQYQPFRYLGRMMRFEDWDPGEQVGERLRPLTAMGYGTPTFAAFYPNSHSVFGFYDNWIPNESLAGVRYEVMGWYSDPDDDFLSLFVRDFVNRFPEMSDGQSATPGDIVKTMETELGLALAAADRSPDELACYGGITITEATPLDAPTVATAADSMTVTMGNTGAEAISAFLAQAIDSNNKGIMEDQLEAIQMASTLEHRTLDIGPKFREARHSRGFVAQDGGTLWVVHPEEAANQPADAQKTQPISQITLSDSFAHHLNEANRWQATYDAGQRELATMRTQLFSDWYKYMVSMYPPEESRDVYPDVDELRTYIEFVDLQMMALKAREIGRLAVAYDENGVVTRVTAVDSNEDAIATHLAAALQQLLADVRQHNAAIDPQDPAQKRYQLKKTAAPRFWQPTEPVVLLQGDAVRQSERYGQGKLDSFLTSDLTDRPVESKESLLNFGELIRSAMETDQNWGYQYQVWQAQPWHPILMEWEVELFPIQERSNVELGKSNYTSDFLDLNYELKENASYLTLRPDRGRTQKGANIYTGTSILTPQARLSVQATLSAYLRRQAVADYNAQAADGEEIPNSISDPTQPLPLLTETEVSRLKTWLETTVLQDVPAADYAKNSLYTAVRAYTRLQSHVFLSQALSGFNNALLMFKQTFQLPIDDPLGFSDYQAFSNETVRTAVGEYNRLAPEPLNEFNPIRSGALNLLSLRLVDTFGRVSATFGDGPVTTTEEMTNPNSTYPVFLTPRIMQPARLNFRFLSATHEDLEMNAHPATTPICGWVLPNNLDNSLMCYDSDGKPLGSILSVAVWQGEDARWEPAPGAGGLEDPELIANPHLRQMVAAIRRHGPEHVSQFISALDTSLENIDPENFAEHQGLALLMARPLALVRAQINAELAGPPAVHQGWHALLQNMQNVARETDAFEKVTFPIRMGEHRQLNDGLAGYWVEENGRYQNDIFYSPQDDNPGSDLIHTRAAGPINLSHSLEADPITVAILVDPRGSLHATSGILPTKQISLPPSQFAHALSTIEITFLSAPLLTHLDEFAAPLPTEPGYAWSWVEKDDQQWRTTPPEAVNRPDYKAAFKGKQRLREGWLKLTPIDTPQNE